MMGVGLYSISASDRPALSVKVISAWVLAALPFLLGFGTGVMSSDRRRPSTGGRSVGWPSGARSWCHFGGS